MVEPRGPRLARRVAVVLHVALIVLLLLATTDRPPCTGDFVGSCDFSIVPLLVLAAVFVLLGLIRWFGGDGPVGLLVVADLTALGYSWLNASTTGIRLAALGALLALVALLITEASRRSPIEPRR